MVNKVVIFKHKEREWAAIINDCGIDACVVTITEELRVDWKNETGTEPFGITLEKSRITLWEI